MQGLSPAQVKLILRRKEKRSTGYAIVRTETGTKKVPLDEVDVGSFVGKVGTIRRSRKGRTYHAANGRRYYEVEYGSEVIAYRT